jgi:hypothetical protein
MFCRQADFTRLSSLPVAKRLFIFIGIVTLLALAMAGASPAETALKSKSPFKDFTLDQVSDGQILESREGSSLSPQIEAVQTCFIVKASPDAVAARILSWNPAGKSGLEVSKHQALDSSAGADAFEKTLAALFKSSGGDADWIATQSKNAKDSSCELLLTPGEKNSLAAASTPTKLTSAWATLLANRFSGFRDHGAADFNSLRSAVKKLGAGDIPSPSDAVYYWEVGDVSDRGKLSEGVSWSDSSGPLRVFDGEFFVTSEYTASLNVSTLWPVTVNGKTVTLVWRIDSAFSNQFTDQGGAERIASSGLILASTRKTIDALRQSDK